MKKIILLILIGLNALAQTNPLAVSAIPASLTAKAHAVKRLENLEFNVLSEGESVRKMHYIVSILDENALSNATLYIPYDKMNKVSDIKGTLYDAEGKELKNLKKSEIKDISMASSGSLFEDNRMKIAELTYAKYPFTVEFSYEIRSNNMLFYPDWFPQDNMAVSIQAASLTISMPYNLALRYKEINGIPTVQKPKPNVFLWTLNNLPARESEPYATHLWHKGQGVLTAPSSFTVENYKGSMLSWKDLSAFFYQLIQDRGEIPVALKEQLIQLTQNIAKPEDKIKKIYEFLQGSTRYVSIQLGIGGWQPFPATTVAEKGYGDCKALSNYTKSLLKAIGIDSHYAIILAGDSEPDVDLDFPSCSFNHVVLCVPMPKDTLWLECTSQSNPFGYQGDFTGDRHALLVMPTGGKLVKTTTYKAADNLQIRNTVVDLDADGNAKVASMTLHTGLQQDGLARIIDQGTEEDQQKYVYKSVALPSFDLLTFALKKEKKKVPEVSAKLSLFVRKCASKSGKRMFLTPNLLSQMGFVPPLSDQRSADVEVAMSYIDVDTLAYNLPTGFVVETLPMATKLESKFGSYENKTEVKGDKLLYIRRMTKQKGRHSASVYPELLEFYKKISKADRAQAVLVSK